MPHSSNGLWGGAPSTPTRIHLWGTQACWLLLIEVCSLTHAHTAHPHAHSQESSAGAELCPLCSPAGLLPAGSSHPPAGSFPRVGICILTGCVCEACSGPSARPCGEVGTGQHLWSPRGGLSCAGCDGQHLGWPKGTASQKRGL